MTYKPAEDSRLSAFLNFAAKGGTPELDLFSLYRVMGAVNVVLRAHPDEKEMSVLAKLVLTQLHAS